MKQKVLFHVCARVCEKACVRMYVSESNKFHPQASSAFSCGVSLPLSSKVYQITQRFILLLYCKG